jgi:hypothetical protein
MEEKIVLKVIDIVDVTVGPKDLIPVIDITMKNGVVVDHAFVFKSNEARDEFMKLSNNSLAIIKYISYKQGLRKGFMITFGVLTASVLGGLVVTYCIDTIKKNKTSKKSDI